MNCREFRDLLGPSLEEPLPQDQETEFSRHRQECPSCRTEWEGSQRLLEQLKGFYSRVKEAQPAPPLFSCPSKEPFPQISARSWFQKFHDLMASSFWVTSLGLAMLLGFVGWSFLSSSSAKHFSREMPQQTWHLSHPDRLQSIVRKPAAGHEGLIWYQTASETSLVLTTPGKNPAVHLDLRTNTVFGVSQTELVADRGLLKLERFDHRLCFRISTPHVLLTLSGTTVSAMIEKDQTIVELESGRVTGEYASASVVLTPGQEACFRAGAVVVSSSTRRLFSRPWPSQKASPPASSPQASETHSITASPPDRRPVLNQTEAIASVAPSINGMSEPMATKTPEIASNTGLSNPEEVFTGE